MTDKEVFAEVSKQQPSGLISEVVAEKEIIHNEALEAFQQLLLAQGFTSLAAAFHSHKQSEKRPRHRRDRSQEPLGRQTPRLGGPPAGRGSEEEPPQTTFRLKLLCLGEAEFC